jgi:hypothetical protein
MGNPVTIRDLRALLDALDAQRRDLQTRLAHLDENRAHVQATLDLLGDASLSVPDEPELASDQNEPGQAPLALDVEGPAAARHPMSAWERKLNGLTQAEAVRTIAEEFGGTVPVAEIKRILIGTGKSKGKVGNVGSHVYHVVNEVNKGGVFERIKDGIVRLRTSDSPEPAEPKGEF